MGLCEQIDSIRTRPVKNELLDRYENLLSKSVKCQNEPIVLWHCGTAESQNHKVKEKYMLKPFVGFFIWVSAFIPHKSRAHPKFILNTSQQAPHHPQISL